MKERIQKIIAQSGLLSRRKAEEAMLQGRVQVNGSVIRELGTQADPEQDKILVDGKPLPRVDQTVILLLHKPTGTITSRSDPEGRPTVMELLPEDQQRLKPVGRLDFDSEGLLLFTNNGELAYRLTHPKFEVKKIYEIWLDHALHPGHLHQLTDGVELDDGMGRFLSIEPMKNFATMDSRIGYRVVVCEGRNRFIRRMFEAVGERVIRLKRIQMGPFALGRLQTRAYYLLEGDEVEQALRTFQL